jgi:hypothetical protein
MEFDISKHTDERSVSCGDNLLYEMCEGCTAQQYRRVLNVMPRSRCWVVHPSSHHRINVTIFVTVTKPSTVPFIPAFHPCRVRIPGSDAVTTIAGFYSDAAVAPNH